MSTAAEPLAPRPLRPLDLSVLFLVGAVVLWIGAALLIPLFPDEMYYWEWSRHLAAGYFDHPPAIAWLIRGGTLLLGATPLGVRLPTILCGVIAALGVRAGAAELGGAESGGRALGIFAALPLLAGAFILATPDAPLLAAVSWALYAVLRATRPGEDPRISLRWWLVAGVLLGLGFLSKYTLVLVPAGVALAAAMYRPLRRFYAAHGPFLAVLLAAVVILPLLLWNASHDWISFRFQLAHGLTPRGGSALDREVSFLAGQVALASPILFVMLAWATGKTLRDSSRPRTVLLAGVVVLAFGFFAWSASRKPVEANWPALAYPAAIVLLAAAPLQRRGRRWLTVGRALGMGLTSVALLLVATSVVTFDREPEATAQAYGWKEVADTMAAAAGRVEGGRLLLAANRYQDAAALTFQLPGNPEVFALNFGSRPNQYDLWPGFAETARPGDRLLLMLDDSEAEGKSVLGRLQPYFTTVERGGVVERRRGVNVLGRKRIWLLSGWLGGWPVPEAPAVRR